MRKILALCSLVLIVGCGTTSQLAANVHNNAASQSPIPTPSVADTPTIQPTAACVLGYDVTWQTQNNSITEFAPVVTRAMRDALPGGKDGYGAWSPGGDIYDPGYEVTFTNDTGSMLLLSAVNINFYDSSGNLIGQSSETPTVQGLASGNSMTIVNDRQPIGTVSCQVVGYQ